MARALVLLVSAIASGLLMASCIDGQCFDNADCSDGKVCELSTGECVTPECTDRTQCEEGQICENYGCVEGCLTVADCQDDQDCHNHRCVDLEPECNCPLAPTFCAPNLDPAHTTADATVCVPAVSSSGVLLFFGSVGCSVCRSAFAELVRIKTELEGVGQNPYLVFVQLMDRTVEPSNVTSLIGSNGSVSVVQDTQSLEIALTYRADWYHAVLIGARGCIEGHYGPVSQSSLAGADGVQIKADWLEAMSIECPESTGTATE